MTIVVYECDTCNRSVERQQNKKGLDFIGRCVITDGCKGKLNLRGIKPIHKIPTVPKKVDGLDDWIKRSVLYTHKQTIKSDVWYVNHQLGSEPATQVYLNGSTVESLPDSIEVVGPNEIKLVFESPEAGVAQCLARSSAIGQPVKYLKIDEPSSSNQESGVRCQVTINQLFSIGVDITSKPDVSTFTGVAHFVDQPTGTVVNIPMTFEQTTSKSTPWGLTAQVLSGGKLYNVFTGSFDDSTLLAKIDGGSSLYIEFDGQPAGFNDSVIMLLTDEPFDAVDRNYDSYVSLSGTTLSNANASLLIDNQEIFSLPSLKQSTYPPIKITK